MRRNKWSKPMASTSSACASKRSFQQCSVRGVVVAEVEALGDPEVGVLADAVVDRPHRRQRATREDVLGDPRVLMAGGDHP